MSKLFAEKPESCPECDGKIVIRNGNYGPFKGCTNYPQCHYRQPLKKAQSHVVKIIDDMSCPTCGQALVLRQGPFGMYIACEHYPQACQFTQQTEQQQQTAVTCPLCQQGNLVERQSRFGKKFFACDGYPACQFLLNTPPLTGECAICHFPLLTRKKTANGIKIICANKRCGQEQACN